MIDPDDEIRECQQCGREFYYNVRYHKYTRSPKYCRECMDEIEDRRTDDYMQRRKDGE